MAGADSGDEYRDSSVLVTQLLNRRKAGDDLADAELFETLQKIMRETAGRLMRKEKASHTLQATAVVNEAVLRLIKDGVLDSAPNRRFLIGAANRAMKQVLVDHARARNAIKRPQAHERTPIDIMLDTLYERDKVRFEDLYEALQILHGESDRQAEVIELRFLSGLALEEIAEVVGIGLATVKRDLAVARNRLRELLGNNMAL